MERAERIRETAPERAAARRSEPAIVVRAKLEVGAVDDVHEREADAVADQVVRAMAAKAVAPTGADRIPHLPAEPGRVTDSQVGAGPEPSRIQRRAAPGVGPAGGAIDRDTEQRIQASRGRGTDMPNGMRSSMETAFGADFSGVRVHTGSESAELNHRIQAKAFTVGNDIHFRDGLPDTSTAAGQHLLAHELTHTIQQSGKVTRIARRPPGAIVSERVQPTRIAVGTRTAGPVVQRAGEAKKAYEAIVLLVTEAKELREKAEKAGTTLDQLAQYKVDVDRILVSADAHIKSAQADKTGLSAYAGLMKTQRVQIVAAQEKIASPEFAATGSLTAIQATLADFQGSVTRRVDEAQVKAMAALDGMRDTKVMQPGKSKTAATAARAAATDLAELCRAFDTEASEATVKVTKWVKTAQSNHLAASPANTAAGKLTQCIQSITSMLGLLRADAERAADHAGSMADAVAAMSAAAKDKAAKDKAQKEQEAAATESDKALLTAEQHAGRCADEAAAAKKLADEAIAAAAEAEQAASGAEATARAAEGTAMSARGRADFFARHAAYAPSNDASAAVDQQRREADAAGQAARDRRADSDRLAVTATETKAASEPFVADATAKGRTSGEAEEARKQAAKKQTSAHQSKADADLAASDAASELDTVRLGATAVKNGLDAHGSAARALIGAVPDATLRTQLRMAYGDANLKLLLDKGITAQLLLDAAPAIKALAARWSPSDTGDVVRRVEVLGGSALLLTAFHDNAAKDVAAPRALQLLDCPAEGLAWFVNTGVASASKLLDHGWSTANVTTLLRAAEKDAKLGALQLATFVAVVEKITMPVATAEKVLKSGASASYLIDHALSSVEKLLAVPWDVDKLVALVKAANDLCKPDKAQFEKFAKLVGDNGVSQDNAVAMMKGAHCTGAYLVDTAFLPVRDAVVDGWNTDQVKAFVHAAENDAKLTKVQIERFYKLVHDNTFSAANAKTCLERTGVTNWTFLMDRVDDFIADGNKGVPAAMGGVAADSHRFGPQGNKTTIELQVGRVQHFVDGHTYKHYVFSHDNIYRGGGNQPSSMWPRGKTASQVAADALAAIKTAAVQVLATNARNGAGSKGDFDQDDFGAYVAGIQAFGGSSTTLMQFFPNGTSVPPDTMAAIGCLFRGGI